MNRLAALLSAGRARDDKGWSPGLTSLGAPRPGAGPLALAAVLSMLAAPAVAQIQAQPLGGLDLFRAGAGETGLPEDLWRGTSAVLAQDVFERLDDKPLSPAARVTALALLRTGAAAPDGAARDAGLAAARASALLALGDPAGVDAILDRTPGLADSAALSEPAAEANLFVGRDEDACALGRDLREARDAPYWVKLRAYCDAVAGRGAQAQLALRLLEAEGVKDEPFMRLMGALLAGEAAKPGAASLRTGVQAALSRRLGLDLASAVERAAPAALPALISGPDTPEPVRTAATTRGEALGLLQSTRVDPAPADAAAALAQEAEASLADGSSPSSDLVDRAVRLAAGEGRAVRGRAQGMALLLAAAGAPVPAEHRAAAMRFEAGAADAAGARRLALDLAADAGAGGEAALVALDIALGAGPSGPKLADRVEIVRALREAGFPLWRDWAREGLRALAAPPPR